MQNKETRKTTIYLPSEMVTALKQRAKENKRSFNSEIAWALQQYLEQGKEGKRGTS